MHRELKRSRVGELVFIYGRDVDDVFAQAHGVTCGGHYGTVIVEVLHLNGDGPRGGF